MKKIIIVCLLVLMGCGGGGSDVSAPAFTQEEENAIISGVQDAMDKLDKLNKPITDYCRDNPLSSLCYKGTNTPGTYIGFTTGDFSGKTLYLVELDTYSRAEFTTDGTVKAYQPKQDILYEWGTWTVYYGKLFVARIATPSVQTVYTLLLDDTENRYFKTSQKWADGSVHTIGVFYDQDTGLAQAQEFVAEHRIP